MLKSQTKNAYFAVSVFFYRVESSIGTPSYKTYMKLTIMHVTSTDDGMYKCVAKNPRGDTDGTIRVYGEFIVYFHLIVYSYVVTGL